MKVAFATIYDPLDIRRGSGTFYSMHREMQKQGHELCFIGPLEVQAPWPTRIVRGIGHRLGRSYKTYLDPFVGAIRGKEVTLELYNNEHDVLITNDYGIAGNVQTEKPIVIYTDVMLSLNYPEGVHPLARDANLFSVGVKLFQHTIRSALESADLCVFPAQWSANYAFEYATRYDIDPSKIAIIPFGANVKDPGAHVAKRRTLPRITSGAELNLLFVGKEWNRKGGDIAVEATKALRQRGINALLHVVGSEPTHLKEKVYVRLYGYLDKANVAHRDKFRELFRTSHILILPSAAEGLVISVLEAAAYGLPVLAYRARGVTEAVQHGESGILIELGRPGHEFADIVERWVQQPSEYERLVSGARSYYENETNWSKSVTSLFDMIERIPRRDD